MLYVHYFLMIYCISRLGTFVYSEMTSNDTSTLSVSTVNILTYSEKVIELSVCILCFISMEYYWNNVLKYILKDYTNEFLCMTRLVLLVYLGCAWRRSNFFLYLSLTVVISLLHVKVWTLPEKYDYINTFKLLYTFQFIL